MHAYAEHRRDERYPVVFEVALSLGRRQLHGKTLNLSVGGARVYVQTPVLPVLHDTVYASVFIPGIGRADTTARVVWVEDHQVGLEFTGAVPPRLLAFTALQDGGSAPG